MKKRTLISIIFALCCVFITHNFWLYGKNTEYFLLITILVLSFLLFCKLADYLAEFKTLKYKSRIEIIFLTIFFIMLFIPMLHIDKSEISEQENRTLAKWQPFITAKGQINYDFGKNFNEWFNDRFFTRKYLVGNDFVSYRLAKKYYEKGHFCLDKENHWIVNTSTFKIDTTPFEQKDMDKAVYNVNKIKEFCDKNNIKPYILIAPRKEEIYTGVVKKYNKDFNQYEKTTIMQNYIQNKTSVPIVYAFDDLKKLSKEGDYAYFKTDHHWTDGGAYKGYLSLMKVIKNDFPDIAILKESDFDYFYSNKIRIHPDEMFEGISYKLMGLHDSSLLDTKYKYFRYKDFDKVEFSREKCLNSKSLCKITHIKTPKRTPNLAIYGDSFSLNLLQSMPYSFGKTEGIYVAFPLAQYKMKVFEEYIKEKNTDILVLCFCEINHLMELYE